MQSHPKETAGCPGSRVSCTERRIQSKNPCGLCLVSQLCPTLCDPVDCGPPGSSVRRILRQEHWGGLPLPPPGDLPHPGSEPGSPALQADSSLSKPPGRQNCLKSLWGKVLPLPHASLRTAKWEILAVNYRLTITSVYCPRCPGFPPCIHARETGAAHIIRHLGPESLSISALFTVRLQIFTPFSFLFNR